MATNASNKGALAQVIVPSASIATDLGLVGIGATVTALCAQISIPWEPVPFSLQTLAVGLCGLTLGARRGAMSQVAYLAAGAAGLPVFASGHAGPQWLLGPTGGYLVSFVIAALLVGWLADRGWTRKVLPCAAAAFAGSAVVLAFGTAWLSLYLGLRHAWLLGAAPFIGSEAIKAIAATMVLPAAWSFTGRK